jgi:LmbE family N-acetylglucosaminyl deacetylase
LEAVFPGKIAFDSASRLLLIAAHPDDEALGCSIVLQRAVRAGASVQVVYATDGENNPWPQRLIARKWRLDARDRKRWGRLRRIEALKALSVLGVAASNARFLGWPDQGLTNLLASNAQSAIGAFTRIIRDWSPTHLLVPSITDTHPDHSALGIVLRLALAELLPTAVDVSVWTYAIHGLKRASLEHVWLDRQSPSETARKTHAIRCHRTQLRLSHRRFLAYAERPERFIRLAAEEPLASGLIRSFSKQSSAVCLILRRSIRTIFTRPMLFLFGQGATETLRCVAIRPSIGSARRVEMRDIGNGRRVGFALYERRGFASRFIIPTDIFGSARALFIKVKRTRFRFFDEAGWLEIPAITGALPAQASTLVPALSPAKQVVFALEPPIRPTADIRRPNTVQSYRRWAVVFAAVFVSLAAAFFANINRPWTDMLDFNGAVWSQSAHNILRAGLAQTSGASSGFYFGPLPIPPSGYYLHHPPLLHLAVTALFAVFGEHEWVARLLPIGCSLMSVVLLWSLVCSCAGSRTATLSAAVFATLPMELRYGQMVNFEPCVLMLILGALLCLRYWHLSGDPLWKHGALGLIFVGFWVDWAMYLFGVSLCLWFGQSRKGRRFAWTLLIVALLSAALYLLRIRLLRPDAWENLSHTFVVRLGSSGTDHFTELQWISRVFNSLLAHFFILNWMLAAAGAVIVLRNRLRNEGSLWLLRAYLRHCHGRHFRRSFSK